MTLGLAGAEFDLDTHVQFRVDYMASHTAAPGGLLRQGAEVGLVLRFP